VNLILYALCYQLQSPVEPYLVANLVQGDDSNAYSRVQAWFSVIQTAGSFVVGFLLDRFGLRGAFVVNFLACAASYFLLANATSIELLYLSKVPTLFMHGFLCAQATVSKCAGDAKSRVAALGRLTACYTAGATVGPAIGGYLGANVDHYFGAKLAVLGSLLSAVLSYVFIPGHLPSARSPDEHVSKSTEAAMDGMGFVSRTRSVVMSTAELLLTRMASGVANSMLSTALPLILKNEFSYREDQMGLAQSAMTFATAVCNAFFLGPLASALGSLIAVIRVCLIGTVAGLAVQSLLIRSHALTAELFILLRLFLSLFQFILAGNLTGESTSRVPPALKGTLLGTEHALFSAVRVFTPSLAVRMLNSHGILGLTVTGMVIYSGIVAVWIIPGIIPANKHATLASGSPAPIEKASTKPVSATETSAMKKTE